MNENENKIAEGAEKIVDRTLHPEHETNREARKRQPWMPITGAIVAGTILIAIYFFFMR
jgi:hypothetical protein